MSDMISSKLLLCVVLIFHSNQIIARKCDDCVPFVECIEATELARTNNSIAAQKLFVNAFCGKHGNVVKICCSDFGSGETIASRVSEYVSPGKPIKSDVNEDAAIDDLLQHPNFKLLPDSCGDIYDSRITGGSKASLFEFPWMALISYSDQNFTKFECAGTVINSKYILTAAHCVKHRFIAGVRVGDYNLLQELDCEQDVCADKPQDRKVQEKIIHKQYVGDPYFRHDIALLRLTNPIDLSSRTADTVCLPVTSALRSASIINKQATVTGWGVTELLSPSSILLKVIVPIQTREKCQDFYSNVAGDETGTFCAGAKGKDSCNGDSGGPLMIKDLYRGIYKFVQYGIVSVGSENCGVETPGIYTDVRRYVGWILDNIRN